MSDQGDVVKCTLCKKPKDADETEQCDECLEYICFDCGLDAHGCTVPEEDDQWESPEEDDQWESYKYNQGDDDYGTD